MSHEEEGWCGAGDLVVAYPRWREVLRRGWRRYMGLLAEAGALWPEGVCDDVGLLGVSDLADVYRPDLYGPDLYRIKDLEALEPSEATAGRGAGREVTESSARRRQSDGVRSPSVQDPSLRSPA